MHKHVSPCLCPQQLGIYNNNHSREDKPEASMAMWGLHYPAAHSTDTQAPRPNKAGTCQTEPNSTGLPGQS